MSKRGGEMDVPLSRFGVLVAQLESIVTSSSTRQQSPDPLLCFDLLSELVSAIQDESKECIQQWQRKCEDALFSLITIGGRRPVRRLASLAMGRVISKGDSISIYSRVSTLQGWLVDSKRSSDPHSCSGAAQCLGELYRLFGKRVTSGLVETANIAAKLMKYSEDFVRQDALQMLKNALDGAGGGGASSAYSEAFRIVMRAGASDKSYVVRQAAAKCLKTFANIGAPGLGITELENSIAYCVKAIEDPVSSVRDAFSEALGALLALATNPDAQVKLKGKNHHAGAKKLEDVLHKFLVLPFTKATGVRAKNLRIGLTLSWVFYLQVIRLKYNLPDSELQIFLVQMMSMLQGNSSVDAHALACVLYILRVGITDQMTEPTQRSFLVLLGKQLESTDYSPSVGVSTLRILTHLLKTLGEVPQEFRDILDNTVVAALSHSSLQVRTEAALTLRALAEVDPTCVGGLISYGTTTLHALRESASVGEGTELCIQLNSLHGQAVALAALVSISPKLLLGYPARLPKSVLDVSKKMLIESSRNPVAATVEKEAGWLLLSSLIASMPNEQDLQEHVFDVLLLWADPFFGNPKTYVSQMQELNLDLRVMTAGMEALTTFIKSFISPISGSNNGAVLLQPVLAYLNGALSFITSLSAKPLLNAGSALDVFTIRTLIAYQFVLDPATYKTEHSQIMNICITPFSEPYGNEESSCLRFLLDKRDACLGPWIPGRDWFEDELRAFDGGNDGFVPCVWEDESSSFPQTDSIRKLLVNQKLLCFGVIFATLDVNEKMNLLNKIDLCLKNGKKQPWHVSSVTNACVALLAGLKALTASRPQKLGAELLSSIQSIFLGILADGESGPAQRRASSEGLGLLARLADDTFTARMMRTLLGELVASNDTNYAGSVALSLGCIHRSAGGIALSTLVPATVSAISLLAKSSNSTLQLWALHALLLTIDAAGLSYLSQVQATLSLAMEILLSEENGLADLHQELGYLINTIVAVLGPELSPGSIFFSRCKSVITEISSCQETPTFLESVRFTQQLVLFAPRAVSVHTHVLNLLPTLSSRQPNLRYLAVSTLRHLINKDPTAMVNEKIEENLFSMLNEETDVEIGSLVRATIIRLLYISCPSRPSRWLSIFHSLVLATSMRKTVSEKQETSDIDNGTTSEGEANLHYAEDDEGMIASPTGESMQSDSVLHSNFKREKHLRYRTRVFAAECLSYLPAAVGTEFAHFDLSLARKLLRTDGQVSSGDWLVLHLQELVSLAYQISTGPFESMQPIGVRLLSIIMEKFEYISDPDLPGHILMEQYQAQLVSAVRSAINMSAGPLLLEAGLELATKILTSSIISGDRVALNRMFLLISRPLTDINDLYYPSFAEWVACKIKIRLLAAHASIKSYVYQFLQEQKGISEEYLQLIPQFSSSSNILGKYWISVLKDYLYICFGPTTKCGYKPFLDGIQSPLVSSKVQDCLKESFLLILQATVLDAVPLETKEDSTSEDLTGVTISGHSMVKLELLDYQFLWGLALLVLFQCQQSVTRSHMNALFLLKKRNHNDNCLTVVQFLSKRAFFCKKYLTLDLCRELFKVLIYTGEQKGAWNYHAVCLLSQIVHDCPDFFFEDKEFTAAATELYLNCFLLTFRSRDLISQDVVSKLSSISMMITSRMESKTSHLKLIMALISISCEWIKGASTDRCLLNVVGLLQNPLLLLKKYFKDKDNMGTDGCPLQDTVFKAWASMLVFIFGDCLKRTRDMANGTSDSKKLLAKILAFCLEEFVALAILAHENLILGQEKFSHGLLDTIFTQCCKCLRETLSDGNQQLQMVGIHLLKNVAQREIAENQSTKDNSFALLFIGEVLGDIFLLIQNSLKEITSKESLFTIEECLRLLLLYYTLSKGSECLQGITRLLMEAFLMVFSISSESHSQEIKIAKDIVKKLVSHLVQIPSFATQIKDVMLSMPPSHRQKLQDMIRESVTQGQTTLQAIPNMNSYPPVTVPSQSHVTNSTEKDNAKSEVKHGDTEDGDDFNDDDDWDAFQSLPANSIPESAPDPNINIDKGSAIEGDVVDESYDSENRVADKDESEEYQEMATTQDDKTEKTFYVQDSVVEKCESKEDTVDEEAVGFLNSENLNMDEFQDSSDKAEMTLVVAEMTAEPEENLNVEHGDNFSENLSAHEEQMNDETVDLSNPVISTDESELAANPLDESGMIIEPEENLKDELGHHNSVGTPIEETIGDEPAKSLEFSENEKLSIECEESLKDKSESNFEASNEEPV